ncbi:MAG: signal peptidase I [Candidatus Andeanibacterium colombiense]|uniref:Signal peptidase I n=1 Tax=Candidatus Andeanibacterium colombiense TaxID=3121345 RepID=A0AAJ6BQM7_9SPHN|nr:MAG: signal peptidase I [Sphingomonadaceae bacterium]
MFVFRSFAYAPFSIPSESMMPRLQIGDYLLASKWNYGFSNYSLPFGLRPFPKGRILASQPERGDVVIFKAPPREKEDYIKRVIGLPGDQIQMVGGVLFINGVEVKKRRIADFVQPIDAAMLRDAKARERVSACFSLKFEEQTPDGRVCRYSQFVETLPNGIGYKVLDFGTTWQDDTPPRVVPDGMLFLMGDNRDNSMDSRFPAADGQGVGLVPQDNLVGKASVMIWSTDGSAEWIKPWSWFTAARWSRIGGTF